MGNLLLTNKLLFVKKKNNAVSPLCLSLTATVNRFKCRSTLPNYSLHHLFVVRLRVTRDDKHVLDKIGGL